MKWILRVRKTVVGSEYFDDKLFKNASPYQILQCLRACSYRAVYTARFDTLCRLFNVCLWNRSHVVVAVWKPPRWRDSPRIRTVGWRPDTRTNEGHRSHTVVKNEQWPLRIKTPCMNRPLLVSYDTTCPLGVNAV